MGFLLYSISYYGLALSPSLNLYHTKEVATNIVIMPFQYLKPFCTSAIRRGSQLRISMERTTLHGCPEFDHNLMCAAMADVEPQHLPALRWTLSLSFWDNQVLTKIGHASSGLCFCGQPHTLGHWLWDCHLAQHLRDANSILKFLELQPVF